MAVEAELTAIVREPGRVRVELARYATPATCVYADTYFDYPDRSMDAVGYELRVRTITTADSTRVVLTYKEPAVDSSGAKPEYESIVDDSEVFHTLFTGLGLVTLIAFEKRCTNFRFTVSGRSLLATLVEIPELEGQTFLEVETMAEPDDVPAALTVVRAVLDDLGITNDDLTTQSYTDRVAAQRTKTRQ